jgi:hypothetical protein
MKEVRAARLLRVPIRQVTQVVKAVREHGADVEEHLEAVTKITRKFGVKKPHLIKVYEYLGSHYTQDKLQSESGLTLSDRVLRLNEDQPWLKLTVSQLHRFYRMNKIKHKVVNPPPKADPKQFVAYE